jgi:uncharacterized protein (DUF2126 family)
VNEKRLCHVKKFYRERLRMNRFLTVLITLYASAAVAQVQDNRSALDKAYEEARAAQIALQAAEAKRDQGAETQEGERTGSAAGGSRPNGNYFARQAILEQDLAQARKRYEEALKRWNDLK